MGKDLAAQRKRLRLFRHPLRTLYYFSACATSAGVRGSLWLARHRLTMTLLLPALAGYIFLKQTGVCTTALSWHARLSCPTPASHRTDGVRWGTALLSCAEQRWNRQRRSSGRRNRGNKCPKNSAVAGFQC